MNQTVADTFD